ncbi:MAG: ABC transporter ATP-binding protein [Candidatus Caldarchaeum sp.]|uniref:ABC transporter ATP-binding protein n=1 Tax=Caldiarchaeum subterraneum TaxID=311458 RepID=A0A7C5QDQ0_CALS0
MSAYLTISRLNAGYGEVQVLWDVSLDVPQSGVKVGIIGPNGAGKTTLMKCVAGLLQPKSGKLVFNGRELNRVPADKRVEMGIAYVPAEKELFPKMTVNEVLELGAYTKRGRNKIDENLEFVFHLFPRLKERRLQKAGTLSGGEQQMLAIGRALMSSPELLLLDEPSTGLAPLLVKELFKSLDKLRQVGSGLTMLLVEQRVPLALSFCDQIYVLEGGRVVLSGQSQDFLNDPRIRASYIGGA